jgi:DNA-binding LacI/PurR family transcriptional regulator
VVSSDWGAALIDLLKTLKDQGHKNFAFAASRITDQSVPLLTERLEKCCGDTGFCFSKENFFRLSKNAANQAEDGMMMGRKIFSERTDIDVIFVWNSFQAYGLIRAAQEAGKRIPEDVTIIVRDNTWISKYSTVPLFTIDQRLDLMAQNSFNIIEQRLLSKKWSTTKNIKIKSEFVCPSKK